MNQPTPAQEEASDTLNPVRAAMLDDPAHYRWTSYRAHALGQTDTLLTPHPLYLGLGATDRQAAIGRYCLPTGCGTHRRLPQGDQPEPQPLGNERFYTRIARMTGQRGEAKPRGRPRLEEPTNDALLPGQGELGL